MSRAASAGGEWLADVGGSSAGDDALASDVPLTVAAVAARLGVAPSTLRTWDRRYGLGPSGRSAGSHRRYTPDDVARLETMRRLTLSGAAPSDAARVAAKGAPSTRDGMPLSAVREPVGPMRVDSLSLAAAAVDGAEPRVRGMVDSAVRARGILGAWLDVAQPAFGFLADREPGDRPGREPEPLLAMAVLAAVRDVAEGPGGLGPSARARVALLAGSGAVARLASHVLAAALAERGVCARVFPRVNDVRALLSVAESDEAGAVCIFGEAERSEELARAAGELGRVPVFLIGPEAPDVWLPGVLRVRTLPGAVHEIVDVLGPAEGPGGEAPDPASGGR